MAKQTLNQLYIIRGLPGSGKSTFANKLLHDGIVSEVVEADEFMTDDSGNYQFDPSKLKKCHEQCQAWTQYYLDLGRDVAVANTFTRKWEMMPYIKMGYSFTVVEMTGKFKSIHNVPQHTINEMKNRWEKWT